MIPPGLPARLVACLLAAAAGAACAPFGEPRSALAPSARIEGVKNMALTWPKPEYADAIFGIRPLHDGSGGGPVLAITRAVLQTNPRLAPAEAVALSDSTVKAAREQAIEPEFLAALLLQESAFDPEALSYAGAIGIAQFMPETASGIGVDPFDPYDAIRGCASLIGSYLREYSAAYPFPYAEALAAYNAGPGAVAEYHGIPPYEETRTYIDDIFDRWAKIVASETRSTAR